MRGLLLGILVLLLLLAIPLRGQSIKTDDDIETDRQLVSNVATGTAPLAVSSATTVRNLNADYVDGIHGIELWNLLSALQAQVDALGTAPVPRTGQSAVWATGDDGDLQLGVAWPNPRFTDHGDGTVTDRLTGLIWLADANCYGSQYWADAVAKAAAVFDGCSDCGGTNNDCGLDDGSIQGQWRLPNVRELQSLIHYGFENPAIPDTSGTGKWSAGDPFEGVQPGSYWSSTSLSVVTLQAWKVDLHDGDLEIEVKTSGYLFSWPVRGGE